MSASGTAQRPTWLIVIELDDVVPRRDASKPNLYVAKTVMNPEERFNSIQRSKKKRWYTDHVIRLRQDLSPRTEFKSSDDAKKSCSRLIRDLSSSGFTVNRDTRVWTVYVVELDETAIPNPGKGFVYVGETSQRPEDRFRQHKDGARNSHGRLYAGIVNRYGIKLRPDLAPQERFFDKESAKRAEREHFDHLKSMGFTVKGGH